MQFLWKSQLKKERGKFLVKNTAAQKKTNRKERLVSSMEVPSRSYAGVIVLWFLFLGTGVYVVFFSPYLILKEPEITGLERIDRTSFLEAVRGELDQKYLRSIARNRYGLIRSKALEQGLRMQYPLIRNIEVEQVFPDTVILSLEERETILLWCTRDTCVHILEDGTGIPVSDVYQTEENQSRTLVLRDMSGQSLLNEEKRFEDEWITMPTLLKRSLQEQFSLEIEKEMSFSSRFANELRVKTTNGFEIFFGTKVPLESSLGALALLLEKEIPKKRQAELEYIDLRTENKVFYRYRDREGGEEK